MKSNEVEVGNRFTMKVSGNIVSVRVLEIYEVGGGLMRTAKRYRCRSEKTGREIIVKSAAKFRAKLGTPINEIWK